MVRKHYPQVVEILIKQLDMTSQCRHKARRAGLCYTKGTKELYAARETSVSITCTCVDITDKISYITGGESMVQNKA